MSKELMPAFKCTDLMPGQYRIHVTSYWNNLDASNRLLVSSAGRNKVDALETVTSALAILYSCAAISFLAAGSESAIGYSAALLGIWLVTRFGLILQSNASINSRINARNL